MSRILSFNYIELSKAFWLMLVPSIIVTMFLFSDAEALSQSKIFIEKFIRISTLKILTFYWTTISIVFVLASAEKEGNKKFAYFARFVAFSVISVPMFYLAKIIVVIILSIVFGFEDS